MIIGERIRFRGVERGDIPNFVEWLNDPEVQEGILLNHPVSRATEENWFEEMIKRPPDEHVMGIEAAEPSEDGSVEKWRLIGTCAFDRIDWRIHAAEFGIMIGDKTYWNRGYGTEAVRLLVQHGFNTLNLNRIYLHVFENNPRAIRAYEKAGFTHEVRKRQAEYKDGKYIDVLLMSILKDEI
jgi:RimJ/RimL family protein N-acetyltransferase